MSNLQRKPIKPHFPSKWAAILILVTFVDELEFEEQFGWINCNWENKTLVKYNTMQRVFEKTNLHQVPQYVLWIVSLCMNNNQHDSETGILVLFCF
jgi:hypothetical protein